MTKSVHKKIFNAATPSSNNFKLSKNAADSKTVVP